MIETDRVHTEEPADGMWNLKLYVAGQTPKSLAAAKNLRRLCEQYLGGNYNIELIDLMTRPELAQDDQIVAIPTLVRTAPSPTRKLVGDLSNEERAIIGLGLNFNEQ